MKRLTVSLEKSIFEETEGVLKEKGIPRNRNINEALDFYNRYHKRKKISQCIC